MDSTVIVTVITPTLNSERHISSNLMSVRSQTYPHIEHIIIDGGSTDRTLDLARSIDPEAILISEPDKGISHALNKGLWLAAGQIIGILHSDDRYANEKVIERIVHTFSQHPGVQIVYGKALIISDSTGAEIGVQGQPFRTKKMGKYMIMPHPAIFARRAVYRTIGGYLLDYKVAMDYEFFLRATRFYNPYFVDETFAVIRSGGLSERYVFMSHWESYRAQRANGVSLIEATRQCVFRVAKSSVRVVLERVGLGQIVLLWRKHYSDIWRR